MYETYFGLKERPFTLAPDPGYLFMSESHREALAHLRYGLENDAGFVLLTGEVGTGKTTVCRCLLEQAPDDTHIAVILNPKISAIELLEAVCDELGIAYPQGGRNSIKSYVDRLNTFLLEAHAAGKRTVLIIDEAQNLETDVLEQIRLLTNLETNQHKLLHIIMLGQPELQEKLARKDLRQLSQRISARHHLGPLSARDTKAYILHRLAVAGMSHQIFPVPVLKEIYSLTGGIPRLINLICDRALLGVYSQGKRTVNKAILKHAAREIFGAKHDKSLAAGIIPRRIVIGALACICLIVGTILYHLSEKNVPIVSQNNAMGSDQQTERIFPATIPEKGQADILSKIPVAEANEEHAFADLLQLWGIEALNKEGLWPCEYAEQLGFRCIADQGSFEDLLHLNRPAILIMENEAGEEFHAVLSSVKDGLGTFLIDGKRYNAPHAALALSWNGRYIMLWRPPQGYEDSLRPGQRGPAVVWLRQALQGLYPEAPVASDKPDLLDENLVRLVKRFQLQHGLAPDGIAGKETLIVMNTQTGNNVPLLKNGKS